MKRNTLALTLILALLVLLLAETLFINLAKANPFPTYPVISIESPTNKTYTANSLFLNVTLVTQWDGLYFTSERRLVSYCIDGKESIPITQTEYRFDSEKQASIFSGSAVLADLTEGTHNLRVNAEYSYDNGNQVFVSNSNVNFTIDPTYSPSLSPTPSPSPSPSPIPSQEPPPVATPTPPEPTVSFTLWHTNSPVLQPPADREAHIPPIIEIVSPENQTVLRTSNITLNVNVASYFWIIDSVYYQADWQEGIHRIFGVQSNYIDALNASITVNFTEIPDGNHSVMVYVNTHDDSHSFATVNFSVVLPMPTLIIKSEPFPTTLVIASVVVIAVVCIGLFAYSKKFHRDKSP